MLEKRLNTVSAYQVYQLLRYATMILIGIVFAKSALTQADIGNYETFLFLAAAISFFWLNGLLKAMLPLAKKYPKSSLFSSFVLISFFSLITALTLYFFHHFLSRLLLNGKEIVGLQWLILYIIFGMPTTVVEFYYIVKAKNKGLIYYGLITFSLQFLLVVVPPLLGYGIISALKGLVVISLLRYCWFWILVIKNQELHLSKKFLQENIMLGWPLITAMLLSGSAQFIDGFIVTSHFDETTFAIFRFGTRELPLAILLTNALNNALLTNFGDDNNLHTTLATLKKRVTELMHLLFPITIVLMVIAYPLFPIVFNADFRDSATIFNIYLLLIISRLLMPQTILNGLLKTKELLAASILELIINVALSLWFVQYWGIVGVAYATVIAFLSEKLYLAYRVKSQLAISISRYVPVKKYMIYSVITIIVFIFTELYFNR